MTRIAYLKKITSDNLENLLGSFKNYIESTDRCSSARSYLGDIKRFSEWLIARYGSFIANAITPLDLVEYRRYLQEQGGRNKSGAAPATVNRALISIKIFFSWLNRKGEIKDNPAEDIKPVAIATTPAPKWLNRNQQAAFFRAVKAGRLARDEAIIGLMLHAGLRVGEVCSLKRSDLYLSAKHGKVSITGKGNKYREVPLNITIRKILFRWLEENKSETLFPNKYGKPISTRGVFNMVKEYAYLAKLDNVSPHTLRHTFCKNAIDMGIPIDQLAVMAGHSSLDITKRYTTPSQDDLQAAVERFAWE